MWQLQSLEVICEIYFPKRNYIMYQNSSDTSKPVLKRQRTARIILSLGSQLIRLLLWDEWSDWSHDELLLVTCLKRLHRFLVVVGSLSLMSSGKNPIITSLHIVIQVI